MKTPLIILTLVSTLLLQGCALTRVSRDTHQANVDRLELVGQSQATSVQRLEGAGFKCPDLSFVDRDGNLRRACTKNSLELFCPQDQVAYLLIDVKADRVISVRPALERGCW